MVKEKVKKGVTKDEEAVSKFDGFGVDFKCKLIGFTSVPAARGDDICQEALNQLTAQALRNNKEKKSHKQKITVNITFRGIRLLDEASERMEYAHPIQRISYISHDNNDKRTFGYIVGTKDGYKLFAIKAMKEAEQITKTLKELFQEVFERHQAQKRAQENIKNNTSTAEPAKVAATNEKQAEAPSTTGLIDVGGEAKQDDGDPFSVDWGQLNEQIQVMQSDGIPNSDSSDMLSDLQFGNTRDPFAPQPASNDPFAPAAATNTSNDFNPFGGASQPAPTAAASADLDFFASQPPTVTTTSKSSDELFGLNAPPAATTTNDAADGALLMNDPFAELKKNINELHKQQQQQQQISYGFNPSFPQSNGFSSQTASNPYAPQPAANNPFTNPNPMYGSNPMAAGAYGAGQKPPVTSVAPNPFLSQPVQPQPQQDMGWTVTKPTPAPRVDVKKTNTAVVDPFAFLDLQTGEKAAPTPPQPMVTNTTNNTMNDPFDLLS